MTFSITQVASPDQQGVTPTRRLAQQERVLWPLIRPMRFPHRGDANTCPQDRAGRNLPMPCTRTRRSKSQSELVLILVCRPRSSARRPRWPALCFATAARAEAGVMVPEPATRAGDRLSLYGLPAIDHSTHPVGAHRAGRLDASR